MGPWDAPIVMRTKKMRGEAGAQEKEILAKKKNRGGFPDSGVHVWGRKSLAV